MNLWRWMGLFVFFVGVSFLLSTKPFAYAGEKEKQEVKPDDKKEEKKDDKKPEAKPDDKKEEKKAEAKNGTELKFTAFDPKAPPFFQEIETKTDQRMKVMGQEVVQKQEQTFYIRWTPQEKKDGNYVVKQKIDGVKMNIDIGGNKITFDSTDPKGQPKNPMTDFFNTLMKQELTFTIEPGTMKVLNIEGREAFVKNLAETNPAINTLLQSILSEDALRQMAEPTWWALPDQPKTKGESWKKQGKLDLGPIGTYHTDYTFTLQSVDADKATIKIEPKMTFQAPKDGKGLPFVIEEAKLSSRDESGEAVFDLKKGRFETSKTSMKLSGDLTIQVGNMSTPIALEQDQSSTVRSFDSDPLGPQKK